MYDRRSQMRGRNISKNNTSPRQQWYTLTAAFFLCQLQRNRPAIFVVPRSIPGPILDTYTSLSAILFGNRPPPTPYSGYSSHGSRLLPPIRIIQFFVCHVPCPRFGRSLSRCNYIRSKPSWRSFRRRCLQDALIFFYSLHLLYPTLCLSLSLFIILRLVHPLRTRSSLLSIPIFSPSFSLLPLHVTWFPLCPSTEPSFSQYHRLFRPSSYSLYFSLAFLPCIS